MLDVGGLHHHGREMPSWAPGAVTAGDGTVIRPSIWGKLKANVQFLAILLDDLAN